MDIAPAAKDYGAILGFLSSFDRSKAYQNLQSEHGATTTAGMIRYGDACVASVVVRSLGSSRRHDRIAVSVPCFVFSLLVVVVVVVVVALFNVFKLASFVRRILAVSGPLLLHAVTGCGIQGFPSAQPYLSRTPAG
jgi:hypothetical protein